MASRVWSQRREAGLLARKKSLTVISYWDLSSDKSESVKLREGTKRVVSSCCVHSR